MSEGGEESQYEAQHEGSERFEAQDERNEELEEVNIVVRRVPVPNMLFRREEVGSWNRYSSACDGWKVLNLLSTIAIISFLYFYTYTYTTDPVNKILLYFLTALLFINACAILVPMVKTWHRCKNQETDEVESSLPNLREPLPSYQNLFFDDQPPPYKEALKYPESCNLQVVKIRDFWTEA